LQRDSPCKVNLLLNILGKRPDGFHELETVMHPVALCDTLTFDVTEVTGVELTCSNAALPCDSSNLVYKSALAFFKQAGLANGGVRIHLEKRIPLAAGLGGGSGNAATTLLALNELMGSPLRAVELEALASCLGSDVPFFLQSLPALATGRGERITPLDWFPALRGASLLLIHPGFGVSTAWAYQALANFPNALHGERNRAGKLIARLNNEGMESLSGWLFNSLEVPVLRKYPILQFYQDYLRDQGAAATLMSGSGSTTFALFRSKSEAAAAEQGFKEQFGQTAWTAVVPLKQIMTEPSPAKAC
jgi:4-diphosphocytidyl-2-C-methyl-D-erythritol kinase